MLSIIKLQFYTMSGWRHACVYYLEHQVLMAGKIDNLSVAFSLFCDIFVEGIHELNEN